jgi:transposase-like protein
MLLAVRWYLRYPVAYEHVAEMLAERGLAVDPAAIAARVRLRRL